MSEPLLSSLSARGKRLRLALPELEGQVTQVLGLLIEGTARNAAVGDLYRVLHDGDDILAEVVALRGNHAVLMPFGHLAGLLQASFQDGSQGPPRPSASVRSFRVASSTRSAVPSTAAHHRSRSSGGRSMAVLCHRWSAGR